MTPDERREMLIRAGEALYGPSWHAPLADALGINVRTVQRWARDIDAPQLGVLRDIIFHCVERVAEIERMRVELAEGVDGSGTGEGGDLATFREGSQ
jgi:hypothetical protein